MRPKSSRCAALRAARSATGKASVINALFERNGLVEVFTLLVFFDPVDCDFRQRTGALHMFVQWL
jgi:predicted GTPase